MDEIQRVGSMVGGATAKQWAQELRDIATKLAGRSRWGPKGVTWPREAARLKLAATIAERGHSRRVALMGAKALAAKLPGLEGKALSADDKLEVMALRLGLEAAIDEEVEQARLDPRNAALDGKAVRDAQGPWGPVKRQAFIDLVVAGGGGTADGKPFDGDPLAASDASFARAEAVERGEVEATPAEAVALERFEDAPRP
jgi:hypothetical protein